MSRDDANHELFDRVTSNFNIELQNLMLDYENNAILNYLSLHSKWTLLIDRSQDQANYGQTGNQLLCMRLDCFFHNERLRLQTCKRITEHLDLFTGLYPECFGLPGEIDHDGMNASTGPCIDWFRGHVAMAIQIMDEACETLDTVRDGIWGLESATQWRYAMVAWRVMKEHHEEMWYENTAELASGWFETSGDVSRRQRLMALLAALPTGAHYPDPAFHWDY